MKKLNIGIAGLGRLGKEYAKNLTYLVPNANLIAACSINKEELDYAQQALSVPNLYSSYEQMLAQQKDMDAVVIVTSTDQHAKQIVQAVEAGYHVFCEKPLSLSIEDCLKVENIVKKHSDKITMLGFVRRYDESYSDAKAKLDQGIVGKPYLLRSQTIDKDTFAPFQIEFCTSGGGIFHDYNVHDIDLAHWYLNSTIKKVWALGGSYRFPEFGLAGDADNTAAMCELENGTLAILLASRISSFGHNTCTEIFATEGNLKIGDPPVKNMLQISDIHGIRTEGLESFFDRFQKAFLIQIQAFVDHVIANKQPELNMKNATRATLVATALTKSFKEKKTIVVSDLIPQTAL